MFTINLYNNHSLISVINKKLTSESTFNCNARGEIDLLNPEISVEGDVNLINFNYAHIPVFKRYYYVDRIVIKSSKLYTFELSVDVLKTYQDVVLDSVAVYKKSEDANLFQAGIFTLRDLISQRQGENQKQEFSISELKEWNIEGNVTILGKEIIMLEQFLKNGVSYSDIAPIKVWNAADYIS